MSDLEAFNMYYGSRLNAEEHMDEEENEYTKEDYLSDLGEGY